MAVLVTGAAGFIGFHAAAALLQRGETVIGVDNLNSYYDVSLKKGRLSQLQENPRFSARIVNIADQSAFNEALAGDDIDRVVHLAAQAGVRHSIDHPFDYVTSNITGHMVLLEYCRRNPALKHLVYASSSSVYGGNKDMPFSVEDRVDAPVSLYAATKKADELMSHCYSHLYGVPQTGLRFFTVYGPWGRPDMAMWLFTQAIFAGKPLTIYNQGDMRRDFTYVDDAIDGVLRALDHPPEADRQTGAPAHRVFNIGNNRSENLMQMVELLERVVGRTAEKNFVPMQPGDVKETYADIRSTVDAIGFAPRTTIAEGIPRFVEWYKAYHNL